MVRADLIRLVAGQHSDASMRDVEKMIDAFFDAITTQLVDGGRVEIRGFGSFSTRARNRRTGRNPRTGELVDVDAKRVPCFKPGKELRERINLGDSE